MRPLRQFYGDRSGTLTDPFGHVWTISTHVEDVSEEELGKRAEAATKAAFSCRRRRKPMKNAALELSREGGGSG